MTLNLTVKETGMKKGTRTLGGGLRPPSEASPQDVVRAAGRRGAGDPPSEASDPEVAPAKPALEARSHSASLPPTSSLEPPRSWPGSPQRGLEGGDELADLGQQIRRAGVPLDQVHDRRPHDDAIGEATGERHVLR